MDRKANSDEAMRIINRLEGRRWNAKDAARLLALLDGSGETRAGFARRLGIKDQRLMWWRHRLGSTATKGVSRTKAERVQFATVVASGSSAPGVWSLSCVAAVVLRADSIRIEIHDASALPSVWVRDLARGLIEGNDR